MKAITDIFELEGEITIAGILMGFMQDNSFTRQGFGVPIPYLRSRIDMSYKLRRDVVLRLAEEGYLSFKPYKGREGKENNRIYLSKEYLTSKSKSIL